MVRWGSCTLHLVLIHNMVRYLTPTIRKPYKVFAQLSCRYSTLRYTTTLTKDEDLSQIWYRE